MFGTSDASVMQWLFNIFTFTLAWELVGLPFDLVGFLIDKRHLRTAQTVSGFLASWCKATTRHSLTLMCCMLCFCAAAHVGGLVAVAIWSSLLAIVFIWKQRQMTSFLSDIHFEPASLDLRAKFMQRKDHSLEIFVAHNQDSGFTGGITGLPGAEVLVVPVGWLSTLTERQLWAELLRRKAAVISGSRTRAVVGAVLFTVTGVTVASACTRLLMGIDLESSAGAVSTSLFFTLWSFLGLLTLPFFSQKGVIEADQTARASGLDEALWLETVTRIDSMMESEPDRSDIVQLVFHPVPTPGRRLEALHGPAVKGAWNLARYAIWLSLVGMGLLGRAVHCNAGRPELWCMPPAD
ncbi:MAG: hypothetical protein U0103_29870 [Candidatus Obscuribacterales bacterium]